MAKERTVVVCLVISLWILFSLSAPLLADQKPVTLRMAYIYAPTSANGMAGARFAKLVEDRTDGKAKFLLFPSGQLGSEIQNREALMTGTLDMAIIGLPDMAAFVPEVAMTDLPYFWRGPDHFLKFWGSALGQEFIGRYESATGNKVLTFSLLTSKRHIIARKAINTPADLRGVKIRVTQGYQHHYDGFLAMGATPVFMAFTEVYSAMQQGVVDAMENPLEDMYTHKFQELAKYVSLTGHIFNSRNVLLGKQGKGKVAPETLAIMIKAAEEAGLYNNEMLNRMVEEIKGKMAKEGVTFVEPNPEPFAEKVRAEAHPKYIAKYKNGQALYDQIQAIGR